MVQIEHEDCIKFTHRLAQVVAKFVDPTQFQCFYFGSRVDGTSHERSDIDVGILGPEPIPFGTWGIIKDAIEELPTLYTIDLVDFGRVPVDFRAVALRSVETIDLPTGGT